MIDHPCLTNGMNLIVSGYNCTANATVPGWIDDASQFPYVPHTGDCTRLRPENRP